MVNLDEKTKAKYVIKTFLCCNKGRKFTAREICNFIVENKLNRSNTSIHYNAIARLIKEDKYPNHILSNVKVEKNKGRNYYYIEN